MKVWGKGINLEIKFNMIPECTYKKNDCLNVALLLSFHDPYMRLF